MNPHDVLKHHVTGAIERGEAQPITEQPVPKVTVTFTREECDDPCPDVSYLEPGGRGPGMSAEDDKLDAARLEAYRNGEWYMMGIRAKATIRIERPGYHTFYELTSPGLWGIESDSGEEYLAEVFETECDTLRADIEAMRTVQFNSKEA